MKNYYFTFGQAHHTEDGTPMKDYYVKVTAADYGSARILFCDHFALPIMGRKDKWVFQYEEKDFNEGYYPNGKYEQLIDIESSDAVAHLKPISNSKDFINQVFPDLPHKEI